MMMTVFPVLLHVRFCSAATERSSNVRVVILSRWGEKILSTFPFVQPFKSCRLKIFRRICLVIFLFWGENTENVWPAALHKLRPTPPDTTEIVDHEKVGEQKNEQETIGTVTLSGSV
jgi:hypothetical protein